MELITDSIWQKMDEQVIEQETAIPSDAHLWSQHLGELRSEQFPKFEASLGHK